MTHLVVDSENIFREMNHLVVNLKNKLHEIKKNWVRISYPSETSQRSLIQTYITIPDKFTEWSQKAWYKQ